MLEAISKISLKTGSGHFKLAERFVESESRYSIDEMIEVATLWASELLGQEEVVAAREVFFAQTGKVFYDDSFYDARISYFIEHFLFERPISGAGRTRALTGMIPYQLFISRISDDSVVNERIKLVMASLAQVRHSLFKVIKVRSSMLSVEDLLIPQKFGITAKSDETYRAFNVGTIFQGFVFRLPETCHLGSGLIIHPNRAKRLISHHIKLAKKNGSPPEHLLLCKLATLQLRHVRHRHVDAQAIYRNNLR